MKKREFLPFGKPDFSGDEIEAVSRILRSGWVGMGPETLTFEEELAAHLGAPFVVTVNSCTSALFLSLVVQGLGPGDEVICPSLTWCSTANAALYLGAKPVFCDVDPETLCLTPDSVRRKLTPKTRAVMAVHMGGKAVAVGEIRAVLPEHVVIIEDAAHALGASFADGNPVGSSGNMTCFSFYANKNLSTGEGGAVALFDEETAERLRSVRMHGLAADAWMRFCRPQEALIPGLRELGYKMNFNDLQASIGRVQLQRQSEFQALRRRVATRYHDRLGAMVPVPGFQRGILDPGHTRHLFQVVLPVDEMELSRDEMVLELRARRVGASIHYAPLHRMPLYAGGGGEESLPATEWLSERIMTLPIGACVTEEDADYVVEQLGALMG